MQKHENRLHKHQSINSPPLLCEPSLYYLFLEMETEALEVADPGSESKNPDLQSASLTKEQP